MAFLIRTLVTAASLWLATQFVPGATITPPAGEDYLVALAISAIALGLLNAIVRPVLLILSLPITCLTLGLFIIVVNGIMLLLLQIVPFTGFHVDGLLSAIVAGIVVSLTSFLLNQFVPDR
jgi:putative membrane protein